MLITFLLLTVGVWVELGYLGYLFARNLTPWNTVLPGRHFDFIAEAWHWTWLGFVHQNLMFDKIYALLVIPTLLGGIVLLIRLLMVRARATRQS